MDERFLKFFCVGDIYCKISCKLEDIYHIIIILKYSPNLQFSKVKYNRLHHATELYKIRAHMRESGLMLHAPCTPEIRPEVRPGHRHGARAPSLTGLCINFG